MRRVFCAATMIGITLLLVSRPADASITAGNDRPIMTLPNATTDTLPAGIPGWPNGPSSANLQDILDYIYQCQGCVDAKANQNPASEWTPSTRPATISPQLTIELSAGSSATTFGMWSGNDLANLKLVPIFTSAASGIESGADFPATATLTWNTAGTKVRVSGDAGTVVSNIYDIPVSAFGFYIDTGTHIWYTDDELNTGGSPQALIYLGNNTPSSAGAWTMAFEDDTFSGSDKDFNDFVVKIESLTAVPEPASMLLMGTAILVLASIFRKRSAK